MSTIRVQALPKFPASVEAGDGITITRTNGTYVFSADSGAGIFQLANATTVRVENALSPAIKPAVEFRDTAAGVTAGGLWRAVNTSGGLSFQKNTSAGGDFSTSTDFLRLDSAAATVVFDAAVNFNSAVLQFSTDPGAGAGPETGNYRNSASPAANDFLGRFTLFGNNSSAVSFAYAQIGAQILDPTASSEDGILMLRTVVAGSLADRLTIGQGAQIGAPAGGDKGTGTLNAATGLYVANVAVPTVSSTDEFTNKTLNTAVGKGTWTASGTWTLPALTLGGAITYGGVTLSNAVTGTGKMVLDAAPTITGPTLVTPALGTPSSGTLTNCTGLGASRASFSANKNGTNQTGIANNTHTQLTFGTEVYDVGGFFASSAWTPPAGKVRVVLSVSVAAGTSVGGFAIATIYRNGVAWRGNIQQAHMVDQAVNANVIADDDASGSDVYTAFVFVTSGGTATVSGNTLYTFFSGSMI